MNEMEIQLKYLQYLQCFEKETQSLIVRLRQRYFAKPKEPCRIVFGVVATLCARMIVGVVPSDYWHSTVMMIVNGLADEHKKEQNGG